ncbi:Phosphatidylinositol-3,4,5-trisphosphate 3-phosphatase and dual-specificity protein phosphatase PTEN [Cucumis melo var. makuwa]|uniref:Phosphatidylinositol-3,4,5-trisphosphate 3-phosphatase and dual-specificity protein phosphatase PTEN n=1 Tax=Cucumis melo var. makuwa TaxID=1194695 RepID=A0A5D3DPL4_CUCMM|nr:Phosphatidylinositol-3,4,5-trisphosphate 3-phosphatase and dual-specificity protein phosphatase PTEN [Cucumis melo var. makuwa]
MLVAGYDLDMSYITDHVLAMSFPAERMRAMYRNPLWQVKSVLDMRHQGHYKIYNLCIEESYDPSHFHGRVESFPFDDNHVPHLQMIKIFCENVSSWLSSHPKNIAVIHCMAGKGRTGLMVCAYLVYCGMSVEDALQLYAQRRTTNNEGVSHVRYQFQANDDTSATGQSAFPFPREFIMDLPRIAGGENEGNKSEVEPHLIVQMDTECSALYNKTCLDYNFEKPLPLTGDVRIIFYAKMFGGRLFYACFNTAFIKNSLLQLRLQDLDKVGKKGRSLCGPSFCLELVFGPANAKHSFSTSSDDDDPQNDLS